MLNVCFGKSECGMLQHALRGEPVTYSHLHLDLGRIHPDRFEEARREWFDHAFKGYPKRQRTKMWKEDFARVKQILERVKTEKSVRIWSASSPCARCGLYFLVYSLQKVDCRIFVVEMPVSAGFRKPPCDNSWGESSPNKARSALSLERELRLEERALLAQTWEQLANESSPLRLNVNGKVTSLPIDYLDEEILSYAPKDEEFSLGKLIATTLSQCAHAVSDSFITERIEETLMNGRFILVGKRPRKAKDYYSKTILRVATERELQERERKSDFVINFLSGLGIDTATIDNTISGSRLEKSYRLLIKKPDIDKKQAIKKLKLKK